MNNQIKRRRGRPIGTGKDDSSTLSRVADLIAANPALRPTTAIKRLLDTLDPSTIRRLQVKWRVGKDEYLAQARLRRTVVVAQARRSNAPYSPAPLGSSPRRTGRCRTPWAGRISRPFRRR